MGKDYNSFNSEDESQVQWDLRQIRAKIIGLHLLRIDQSCVERDYQAWTRNIRLLFKFVEHFVSKKVEDFEKKFNEKIESLIECLNNEKNKQVYFGRSQDGQATWEIETYLFDLEKWVYHGMEESGLWGTRSDNLEGL